MKVLTRSEHSGLLIAMVGKPVACFGRAGRSHVQFGPACAKPGSDYFAVHGVAAMRGATFRPPRRDPLCRACARRAARERRSRRTRHDGRPSASRPLHGTGHDQPRAGHDGQAFGIGFELRLPVDWSGGSCSRAAASTASYRRRLGPSPIPPRDPR